MSNSIKAGEKPTLRLRAQVCHKSILIVSLPVGPFVAFLRPHPLWEGSSVAMAIAATNFRANAGRQR